jgi:hypothetical protein
METVKKILYEIFGNDVVKTSVALFYAYLTSTAMLLFKVARRKPDENGHISEFSFNYLIKDRGVFVIATGIFIFIGTMIVQQYFPNSQGLAMGVLVGVASSSLGKLFELAGNAFSKKAERQINKMGEE